jgi:hypothetical protein
MKKLLILGIIFCIFSGAMNIWRTHEACPFVCRGTNGEWYYTELPTFGYSHTLWLSEEQKEYRRQHADSPPLLPWVKS